MDFSRQSGIIDPKIFDEARVTLVGAGAIGSFTALAITKMGVHSLEVYDVDGVSQHNIPNQFYRQKDADKDAFKVSALKEIISEFNSVDIVAHKGNYTDQPLSQIVIVATDSMASRKLVWEQFKRQGCRVLIEARMGGQMGVLYTIVRDEAWENQVKFYEDCLFDDSEAEQLPCSARSIIYNILVIAGFITRALKSILLGEKFPREIAVDLANVDIYKRD